MVVPRPALMCWSIEQCFKECEQHLFVTMIDQQIMTIDLRINLISDFIVEYGETKESLDSR